VTQVNTDQEIKEFIMTKRISALALMACLATSFAFAADSNKRASSADNTKAEAAQAATTQQDSTTVKNNKKDKHNAKPAPSTQEQEFDKVLLGIHG